jgi:flagellar basal body-associated protein FliL
MADSDNKDQQEEQKELNTEQKESKSLIGRLLPWIIMIVIVGLCAGAGLGLGSILAGTDQQKEDTESRSSEINETTNKKENSEQSKDSAEVWYYELDPVVANLNEPSVARYVSASLTLQISSSVDEKEYKSLIDEKKPILTDWLTVYLAGLGLEDTRGDDNLKIIQSQILDAFNDIIFTDSKPEIKQILFRAFAVQ